MQTLIEISPSELKDFLVQNGHKGFNANQVLDWFYKKGVSQFDQMTNLSKELQSFLSASFKESYLELKQIQDSTDLQTKKFLWQLSDEKLVESVLIKSFDRNTVCVSSQVGCPARCAFCASGREGLFRNLNAFEIFAQVVQIDHYLKKHEGKRVTHVVFMGMGEPLDNYDAVLKSVDWIGDSEKLNIGERKITISTVGLVQEIKKLALEKRQFHLVLSLHAPNQHIRKKIIPYARKYPLDEILEAMLFFAKTTGRDITYEYTLMEGINDAIEHAKELALLVKDHPCTVNLIPYNPVEGLHLKRPDKESIEAFRDYLKIAGVNVTWRFTKGKDIAAACGQLALKKNLPLVQ